MAKAFDWLSGSQYAALQRAMRSIWFGQPAPVDEAAQATGVDSAYIERELAKFVNLVVQALPLVPDGVQRVSDYQHGLLVRSLLQDLRGRVAKVERLQRDEAAIRADIAGVQAKIRGYEQPLEEARHALAQVQGRVGALRSRIKRYEAQERELEQRAQQLEATCRALAAGLGAGSEHGDGEAAQLAATHAGYAGGM